MEPARGVETGRNQEQGWAVDFFPIIHIYVLQTGFKRFACPKCVLFCVYLISSFPVKKRISRMNEMTFLSYSTKELTQCKKCGCCQDTSPPVCTGLESRCALHAVSRGALHLGFGRLAGNTALQVNLLLLLPEVAVHTCAILETQRWPLPGTHLQEPRIL